MFERGNWDSFLGVALLVKGLGIALDRSMVNLEGPPHLDGQLELTRIGVAIVLVCTAIGMWLWVRRSDLQRTGGQAASGTPNPTGQ